MQKREITPTDWLQAFNINHAVEVTWGAAGALSVWTDVEAFLAAAGDLVAIFAGDGCKPVSTLLGMTRLFEPEIMVEFEATAAA